MAQLKLMKKEWFNWFNKTFLDNITAWTEYYYINPDSQHWISNNLIDLSTFAYSSGGTIDQYGNVTMNPTTVTQVVEFKCAMKKGDVITISFDAYSDIDESVVMADIYPDSASPFGDLRCSLTTTKRHFRKTWTLEADSTNIRFFRVVAHAHATESKIFISNISVVVGSSEHVVYNPRLIKIEDILGVYKLEDLGWGHASPHRFWTSNLRPFIKPSESGSEIAKLFCPGYTPDTWANVFSQTNDKSMAIVPVGVNSGYVSFVNKEIDTLEDFIKSIKGKYLIALKIKSPY